MSLFHLSILVFTSVMSIKLNDAVLLQAKGIYSRVSKHFFKGIPFYIKRDDENNIAGAKNQNVISGNKTRKLLELSQKKPFPKIVVSYGGAQSNSMLAIAKVVANSDHGKFLYLTKALPKFLKNTPNGNLKVALSLGMQVIFSLKH